MFLIGVSVRYLLVSERQGVGLGYLEEIRHLSHEQEE